MALKKRWVPKENITHVSHSDGVQQFYTSPFRKERAQQPKGLNLTHSLEQGWSNANEELSPNYVQGDNYDWLPAKHSKRQFMNIRVTKDNQVLSGKGNNIEAGRLSEGWGEKLLNKKKNANRADYRVLFNQYGRPYTVPNGPAKGKIVMFDAWQSNEELLAVYQAAFEDKFVPGLVVNGAFDYADPHMEFTDDGHITRIQYNIKYEVMCVHWANRNYVTCYLGVRKEIYDQLHECAGITVSGRSRHNHLLGIRFWDIIRIRGTMTGGRFPFYYVGGAPSGLPRSDVSQTAAGRKNIAEHIRQSIERNAKNAGMANAPMAPYAGVNGPVNLQEKFADNTFMSNMDAIFNSIPFQQDYDEGKQFNGIDDIEEIVDNYETARAKSEEAISNGDYAKAAEIVEAFRHDNLNELKLLTKKYEDVLIMSDPDKISRMVERQNRDQQHVVPDRLASNPNYTPVLGKQEIAARRKDRQKQALQALNEANESKRNKLLMDKVNKWNAESDLTDDYFSDISWYNKWDDDDI